MNILVGALFFMMLVLWMKVWHLQRDMSDLKFQQQKKKSVSCSFCGKEKSQVRMLVSSDNALICNECVGSCSEIIKAEEVKREEQALSTQTP